MIFYKRLQSKVLLSDQVCQIINLKARKKQPLKFSLCYVSILTQEITMNIVNVTLGIYSILLIIGGVMGYIKADSLISLLIGVGSGLILGYCTMVHYLGNRLHCLLILGLTTLITLFFAYRFYLTGKVFPPAFMIVCGLIVLLVMFFNRPKKC